MDEQLIAYTGTVSAIMPLIVAFVVQSHWPKEAKGAVALAASILAGVGSVYLGGANLREVGVVIPAVLIASQASYHTFWKPTGLAPAFEQASNANEVAKKFAPAKSRGKAKGTARQSSNP
jgi:hypothetical protein